MAALDLAQVTARAKALVARIGQRSSSNFKFAFLFLAPRAREALQDVYLFCRVADDIVDERPPGPQGVARAREELAAWRRDVALIFDAAANARGHVPTDNELAQRLATHLHHFDLPREAFEEIIAGCAMDLEIARYPDLATLELYCYRVASCVGYLCLPIFGDASEAARDYGRHLGLALQYTNILRDVAEDAARDRIYLPQDLLHRHGLSDDDILSNRYDARFIAAAAEFAEIASREYQAADAALQGTPHRNRLLPAEIMGQTYYAILRELVALNFNVHARRPALRRRDKMRAAALALAHVRLPAALAHRADAILGPSR